MSAQVRAYPHVFGLALEHRGAGKPSGNTSLDVVRNRRLGTKNGRTVIAKPRPRGFYYGSDGRLLLKISGPTALQTSNLALRDDAHENAFEIGEPASSQHTDEHPQSASEKASSNLSGPAETNLAFLATIPEVTPPKVLSRDSIEIFNVRHDSSKYSTAISQDNNVATAGDEERADASHRHQVSFEAISPISPLSGSDGGRCDSKFYSHRRDGSFEAVSPVSPLSGSGGGRRDSKFYSHRREVSSEVVSPLSNSDGGKRDSQRNSQLWNGYFSPDGTVRTSIILNDVPTLPRSAYTDSENEFADEFAEGNILPRTIYNGGPHAYFCSNSEYFLPGTLDEARSFKHIRDHHLSAHFRRIAAIPRIYGVAEDYDPALGYLPIPAGLCSSEALVMGSPCNTIYSMEVPVRFDGTYPATPEMSISPLPERLPSPPFLVSPVCTDPRLSWPSPWPSHYSVSSIGSSISPIDTDDTMPSPVGSSPTLPNPLGVAVLERAKTNFQRASRATSRRG